MASSLSLCKKIVAMNARLNLCILEELVKGQYIKRYLQKKAVDSEALIEFLQSDDFFGKSKIFIHGSASQLKKEFKPEKLVRTLFYNNNVDTIFLPVFTPSFRHSGVFSLRHSRSEVGILGDIQDWEFQRRTPDPLHSVRILTKAPADLPDYDYRNTFSAQGFFASTLSDTAVVNINTYRFVCTYLHVFEEIFGVPYKKAGGRSVKGIVFDENDNACSVIQRSHSNLHQTEFARKKLQTYLVKHGAMRLWSCRNNVVSITNMDAACELITRKLKKNPLFLVSR